MTVRRRLLPPLLLLLQLRGRAAELAGALPASRVSVLLLNGNPIGDPAAAALADALPAKARGGAEEWLRGARARLAVEHALGTLDAEISARVAARWQAGEQEGE